MSTIASPRPSLTSLTSVSSRRPSIDSQPISSPPIPARRNRAALRDYYRLKQSDNTKAAQPQDDSAAGGGGGWGTGSPASELDAEGFDAEEYVRRVLAKEDLEGVLRIEAGLINEIKGLDGERKALVYDNYSKLITATETIGKMRMNMDPLTPATSTLSPAVSHIAETAALLATSFRERSPASKNDGVEGERESTNSRRRQEQATVRWVLAAPTRLRAMLEAGGEEEEEEAVKEWTEVQQLLGKWDGVAGVEELKITCMKVMGEGKSNSS